MSQGAIVAPERRGLGANITALAGGQAVTWSMSLLWTLIVPRARPAWASW
jgi:hypothetical protein